VTGRHAVPPFTSTRLTAQLGLILSVMLALLFLSGAMFFLYTFNYDAPPWFTGVRFFHFYVGIASVPILLAKYGTTSVRFAGYYLRVPRFKRAGPPALLPRVLGPLLLADFFVLYFSGGYMLFHYYYTVTNIWPFDAKPVQVHLWAALIGTPLVTIHLLSHFVAAVRSTSGRDRAPAPALAADVERRGAVVTRRAFLAGLGGVSAGLAFAFQNTRLRSVEFMHLFIGRIPPEERGGPGDFPVETLFGKAHVEDVAAYRLTIEGEVDRPLSLSYDDLLALPAQERRIRLSCVSGWTERATWRGPRVRDVLALAAERRAVAHSVAFHSLSGYGYTWHRGRLDVDDALLATHVNGAPLRETHGFPVRLIVPGYPGQSMVKQIDRIFVRADDEEFRPDFSLVANVTGAGAADAACATPRTV
jgi:DMSO/TMAO reductase YedYZ molybdopterin-dependent catalytic subunit